MSLIQWLPDRFEPLALFLCHLGLLSFVYAWIVLTITGLIGSVFTKLRVPFDVGAVLRFTAGHYLLTAMTILAVLNPVQGDDGSKLLYGILATVFLWITLAPEMYEEYSSVPSDRQQRSRLLFVLRMALFVFWITALVLGVREVLSIVVQPLPEWNRLLESVLIMSGSIGIILGALGAYGLFRSLFRGFFATLGLLGEFRDMMRRQPLPAQTLP